MAPSQDPTSSTTGRERRPDRGVDIRPLLWVDGAGVALLLTGILLVAISSAVGIWLWATMGLFLIALSVLFFAVIPGALVALRHPWGDIFRQTLEKRYVHSRLAGLAEVWFGLVMMGALGATALALLVPLPFSLGEDGLLAIAAVLAVVLVALAPMLAIILFDRRR